MKICFLSLNSYPMLTGKNLSYAGGAEVEQVHLGMELKALGYEVCFVTYRHGLKQTEYMDGIEIIPTYNREKADKTNALLKAGHVWSALQKAKADIYFYETGSSGVLPLFSFVTKKKLIYRVPSDAVVLGTPLGACAKRGFCQKVVDILEIKRANVAVAQSKFQERVLEERLRVKSVLIKNGLAIPRLSGRKLDPPMVLWVASISSVKNPDLFIELARSIPNAQFMMVGGELGDHQLYEKVRNAARALPNLALEGFVPYPEVNRYFEKSSIFVNTSSIEGFPNTFIQAWARYTPVVSLNVDPDDIIRNEKLGFHSGTFEQLVSDVTTLLENGELRQTMGYNARKYVEREHDIRKNVKKYFEIFERIQND